MRTPPRQMSLAIVGADYPNKRGPGRRFEIQLCRPGEPVKLVPEPKNPADPLAIAVYSCRDIQIGYIQAERAQLIHTYMSRGKVSGIFQQIDRWGCTIRIAMDGEEPSLPEPADSREKPWPPPDPDAQEWWPDEDWPEQ